MITAINETTSKSKGTWIDERIRIATIISDWWTNNSDWKDEFISLIKQKPALKTYSINNLDDLTFDSQVD